MFQKLLLAPAALGLMAPMAASAADLNIAGVSQYSNSKDQVTSIGQFSDVKPTDWAYQALSNLIERYGCVAGYPNGTFKGGQAITRYEAAALLNACLDRITEVTDELKRLMKEFEKELAVLKGRVDGLEAKVGELQATQFSTTTKLKGIATFVLGGYAFGGSAAGAAAAVEGATSLNYDVKLILDTSFTGKDLLRTTLRAGNFADSAFGNGGLNQLEVAFQENCGTGVDCGDVVAINRLFYQFPLSSKVKATVGARVRQDDMLPMWPSVYKSDYILNVFSFAGAPGVYSKNLGAGAGIWYKDKGFSAGVNYVSANGDGGAPGNAACFNGTTFTGTTCGGIGTAAAQQTFTAQLGYAGKGWGGAVAYNYGNGVGPASGTPAALALRNATTNNNSVGLSGYWQPSTSGWIPSFSAGWGYTSFAQGAGMNANAVAQSWSLGMQWMDAFAKGNVLGMAVGQPTFVTSNGTAAGEFDGNYAWEWWYKFQVSDNISVTPALFYLSNPLGNAGFTANGRPSSAPLTNLGGLIKTTFKF